MEIIFKVNLFFSKVEDRDFYERLYRYIRRILFFNTKKLNNKKTLEPKHAFNITLILHFKTDLRLYIKVNER